MSELIKKMLEGMTDPFERLQQEAFARSWFCAPRKERKDRLAVVAELLAELASIRAASFFATALGESAICDAIDGDWKGLDGWVEHFTFEGERPELVAHYAPLWSRFRDLLSAAALAGRRRERGELPQ